MMKGPPILQCNFINRRTGRNYTSQPKATSINFSTDMRQFTGAFDLEVAFRLDERVEISSHDFVEFFFDFGGEKFQAGVGYLEDFVESVAGDRVIIQANGRDLLGQLISVPFAEQLHYNAGVNIEVFAARALQNSYVQDYLKIKGMKGLVMNQGAFGGPLLVNTTADQNRGAVLQEYAEEIAMNLVYLTRRGRVAIYGREFVSKPGVGKTLHDIGDRNVIELVQRRNFSKVISECRVMYSGGEGNLDLNKMSSPIFKNTEPAVAHVYQPIYKVFSANDLISLSGQYNVQDRLAAVAKSTIRKSNQNLSSIVIKAAFPYHVGADGSMTAYEVCQNWRIKSDVHKINQDMKLAGINYRQTPEVLETQLMFVGPDTLI
ncbi:hypothetical protein [Bdellovibrio bacteriovorus]|uniref:hypothetical protein n=1 Tax=Bdellovibrio bacteriovorus TaxID=959 RepID=UPI003AA9C41D